MCPTRTSRDRARQIRGTGTATLSDMRFVAIVLLFTSAAVAAPPGVTPTLTTLDETSIPEQCRELSKAAASQSIGRAMSARISLANCLLDHKLKPLVLCDCEQSVREVEAAAALSLMIIDELIEVGDPATKILALGAKGDIHSGLATRMISTVPPPVNNTEEAVALRETRMQLLQPHVEPWQVQARAAYQSLDQLARQNPQLAKNQAVLAVVRSARTKVGQGVAKR